MKRKTVILKFLTALLFSTSLSLFSQIIEEELSTDLQPEWTCHKISSFHYSFQETFAFIDDGSIWKVNPLDAEWISKDEDCIVGFPITIMPEAGTEAFPVKVIVRNDKECGWKEFTLSLQSPPTLPERTRISKICLEFDSDYSIEIQKDTKVGLQRQSLFINPLDLDIARQWKVGQRTVVGGAWFPEYDPFGRKEFDGTYLFVLYNYDSKDFIFFSFPPDFP